MSSASRALHKALRTASSTSATLVRVFKSRAHQVGWYRLVHDDIEIIIYQDCNKTNSYGGEMEIKGKGNLFCSPSGRASVRNKTGGRIGFGIPSSFLDRFIKFLNQTSRLNSQDPKQPLVQQRRSP